MCKVTYYRNFSIVDEQSTIEIVAFRIIKGKHKDEIVQLRHLQAVGDTKGYEIAKKALLAFTPCGMFDGGRRMQYLVTYSQLIVLDWDKLSPEELIRVKKILLSCGYTMLCFVSPSGNGLKAIIRVSTGQEHHLRTFLAAKLFFTNLTGFEIDASGKDITRLCFVSWDPEGYFNKNAVVFDPDNIIGEDSEINSKTNESDVGRPLPGIQSNDHEDLYIEEGEPQGPSLQKHNQHESKQNQHESKQNQHESLSGSGDIMKTYKRCIKFIKKNTAFIVGKRNDFIFKLALELRKAGIPEATALFLIQLDFNYHVTEVKNTVKSAFLFDMTNGSELDDNYSVESLNPEIQNIVSLQKEYEDPGRDKARPVHPNKNQTESKRFLASQYFCGFPLLAEMDRLYYKFKKPMFASPVPPSPNQTAYEQRIVEAMISTIFEIRFNVVKGRIEWRMKYTGNKFEKMEDHHENSIYRWLVLHYQFMPVSVLHTTLTSNFSTFFNPFQTYLNGLRGWDKKTDFIGQLIATIKTEDDEYFEFCLRKWFVAYAMSLFDDDVINHTILVLVGSQGVGKSRWLRKLMPNALKEYLAPGASLADYKDIQLMMAECGLIIMDELEALNRRDLAMIKDLLTRAFFQVRRPYARTSAYLPHRASVCASVNDEQILTDTTGTRRYLCSTVVKIDYEHNVSIDGCMSQALALGKSGFRHWFDEEEIRALNYKNESYMLKSMEEELVEKWLRPVTLDEWRTKDQFQSGRNYRLMTSSDVTLFLASKAKIQVLSYTNSIVGRIMMKLKFIRHCKDKKYYYIVRILTDDEVERGMKNLEDTESGNDSSNNQIKPDDFNDENKKENELPF
jgi:predicted P-loop ATPase